MTPLTQDPFSRVDFPASSSPQYRSSLTPSIPSHLAAETTSIPKLVPPRKIHYFSPPSPLTSFLNCIQESPDEVMAEHKELPPPSTMASSTSAITTSNSKAISSVVLQTLHIPVPPTTTTMPSTTSPKKEKAKITSKKVSVTAQKSHTSHVRSQSEDLTLPLSSIRPRTAPKSIVPTKSLLHSSLLLPHIVTIPFSPSEIDSMQCSLTGLARLRKNFSSQEQGRPNSARTLTREHSSRSKPPSRKT